MPKYFTYPLDELVREDPRYQFRSSASVTLDNAVHSCFAKCNIDANLDYNVMFPVFQVMTKELETPRSMGYFSANCVSVPRDVKYTDRAGTYLAVYRQPEPLSEETVAKTKDFLEALAPHLRFQHSEMDSLGTCSPRGEQLPAKTLPVELIGRGSTICLSSDEYRILLDAASQYEKNPESRQNQDRLFSSYFGIAQILLHELAHAVAFARWGQREKFCMPFEDRVWCEDGFDFESTLFGGSIESSGESVWVTEWPSPALVESYLRTGPADIAVTAPLESIAAANHGNVWRMPPCFVRAFFQKEFWDRVVPLMGAAGLDTPKLLGYRRAPQGLGTCYSCDCESCFWLKEYVMRAHGRGNGPLDATGTRAEELNSREIKRRRNKRKHVRSRFKDAPHKAAEHLQKLKSDTTVPKLEDGSDHQTPSADCIRGVWSRWLGPRNADDTRNVDSLVFQTASRPSRMVAW